MLDDTWNIDDFKNDNSYELRQNTAINEIRIHYS